MLDVQHADLPALLAESAVIADDVQRTFGGLTPAQVNWKPTAKDWSIGQCFDHMITTNLSYLPILNRVQAGTQRRTVWERLPVLPGVYGSLLIRGLRPDSGQKLPAPPNARPTQSAVDGRIIQRFLDSHAQIVGFMQKDTGRDTDKIMITSPFSRVITYSLLDAYRILIVHEHNHLAQARRVMQTPGFPMASAI